MNEFTCPLCGKKTPRDLAVFLEHTNQHVVDAIKKEHPEWVAPDGTCRACFQYYEQALSGESFESNLGPREAGKRRWLGIGITGLALFWAFWLLGIHADRFVRAFIFFPLAFGLFNLFEARKKTCAILSERGLVNLDSGVRKIENAEVARKLRIRGRGLMLQAILWALILSVFYSFLPS